MANDKGLADLFYGSGTERSQRQQDTVPATAGQPRLPKPPPTWALDFFGSAPGAPLAEQWNAGKRDFGSGQAENPRFSAMRSDHYPAQTWAADDSGDYGVVGTSPSHVGPPPSRAVGRARPAHHPTSPAQISYDGPLEYSRLSRRQLSVIPTTSYLAGTPDTGFEARLPLLSNPDELPAFLYVASSETVIESRKPDVVGSDDDDEGFLAHPGRKRRGTGEKKVGSIAYFAVGGRDWKT
jgi:hypothetical protein